MGAMKTRCGRQACYAGVVLFAMTATSMRGAARAAKVGHSTVDAACEALGVQAPGGKQGPKVISKKKIIEAWERTKISVQAAAKPLGIDASTLRRRAKELGLAPRRLGQFSRSPIWPENFNEMWMAGVFACEIAKACTGAVPRDETVSREARRRNLPKRTGGAQIKNGITMLQYLLMKDAKKVRAATKELWEGRQAA